MPCAQRQASRSGTERRQRQAEQHATHRDSLAQTKLHTHKIPMNGLMAIELTSSPSWALSNGGNPFCLTCWFDLCCPSTSARGRTQGQASTCALTPAPASIKQASRRPCLPCRRVHKPTSQAASVWIAARSS
jgi:hypothetical protein